MPISKYRVLRGSSGLPDAEALLAACQAIYPPEKEVLGVVALAITPLP